LGIGLAIQVALLGTLGDELGATEAAWISIILTTLGGAVLLVVVALRFNGRFNGRFDGPRFRPPMNRVWPHAGMVAACGVAYGLSVTNIAPHLAIPGLIGLTQMVVSTWLVPRTGVALYLAAMTAGSLGGGVVLDHFGWLVVDAERLDVARVIGVLLLMAGVVLVSNGDGWQRMRQARRWQGSAAGERGEAAGEVEAVAAESREG
jgi:uncharacterized membrane protein YdcZ (DUF606 family)